MSFEIYITFQGFRMREYECVCFESKVYETCKRDYFVGRRMVITMIGNLRVAQYGG